MNKVLYPKLSYQIVGSLFEVYNQLQYGHAEKIYQRALEEEFKKKNIIFIRELYFPVRYNKKIVGKYFFDFLIANKIILEVKVYNDFHQKDINQILSYMQSKGYRLGILALFTKSGIKFRRILN